MVAEIIGKKVEVVRIHSAGDFYSREYLEKWIQIAMSLPKVKFYAYTKMVRLTKEYIIPENLILIYSLGGTEDKYINLKKDRHSKIFNTETELISEGYIKANDNDLIATREYKIGLVKH
jgi:hypothetical protein